MNKSMNFTLRDDLTAEQFEQVKASGSINPMATYEDYLGLRREREENRQEAQRLGLTGDAPPELTEEEEEMLLRAWATVATEKGVVHRERSSFASVA